MNSLRNVYSSIGGGVPHVTAWPGKGRGLPGVVQDVTDNVDPGTIVPESMEPVGDDQAKGWTT